MRNRGGPFCSRMLRVSTYPAAPLALEERVGYLYERNYFPSGSLQDRHLNELARLNFHYFLGYARNYRVLIDQQHLPGPTKTPDDVFSLIRVDHQVAALLYSGLRRAEWLLRSYAVESYCRQFAAVGSFLQESQYVQTGAESRRQMIERIIDSILRYREPFVSDHIDAAAEDAGQPRLTEYDRTAHERCVALVQDLPLWAVIDSFSLGLLSRFITDCAPTGTPNMPWKSVASGLEINNGLFPTNLKALVFLRNLVAHHARMWMRTTADTPRKPRCFEKRLRDCGDKTMSVAFYNLALFQGPDERGNFADQIDTAIAADPNYRWGVTTLRKRDCQPRGVASPPCSSRPSPTTSSRPA